MKNIIIVTMTTLVLGSVSILTGTDQKIDRNFLTEKPFKYGTVISTSELVFTPQGTYIYGYGSEGVNWYNRGTYSIIKETVFLKPDFCSTHKDGTAMDCAETMGEAQCSIQSRPNDLYYHSYFICTSMKNKNAVSTNVAAMPFAIEKSKVKAGASRIFKGIPVVTMGTARGVTATNVKIREKPSVNSKSLEYVKEPYETDAVFESVPAGTEVVVIARTRDRDRVQNWNNYWYLVSAGVTSEVWMYGEFVKIK